MASIEEKVEDWYKSELDRLGVPRWGKNDAPNIEIQQALDGYASKSGSCGRNYPDIQSMLNNRAGRCIPVMMECKGRRGKLVKFAKDGSILEDVKNVNEFAVNGALHYGRAIQAFLPYIKEYIVIGMNGSEQAMDGTVSDLESRA